jgi:hypothetical protein
VKKKLLGDFMKYSNFSKFAFLTLVCMGSAICWAAGGGSIYVADAVTAKGIQGDTLTPVEVTDTFSTSQNIFHTIVTLDDAPENTKVKAVWLNESGNNLGEYELTAGGTRNLDFTFKPNGGALSAGNYAVDIYVNGVYDSTLKFSVTDKATAGNTAQIITGITMALGTKGIEKEPENATNVFKPTDTFHAVVSIADAPQNTRFKASWYLVKSDSGDFAPNTHIDTTELTTEGTRNIDFTLTPTNPVPPGTYRVELWVNGVLDPSQTTFTVAP